MSLSVRTYAIWTAELFKKLTLSISVRLDAALKLAFFLLFFFFVVFAVLLILVLGWGGQKNACALGRRRRAFRCIPLFRQFCFPLCHADPTSLLAFFYLFFCAFRTSVRIAFDVRDIKFSFFFFPEPLSFPVNFCRREICFDIVFFFFFGFTFILCSEGN